MTRTCGVRGNSLKISGALKKRAAQIEVLLMDVDGTMTDGSVTLVSQTEEIALKIKTFDAHDGQGLTLAYAAGLRTGCGLKPGEYYIRAEGSPQPPVGSIPVDESFWVNQHSVANMLHSITPVWLRFHKRR
jgi:hypothetical protein